MKLFILIFTFLFISGCGTLSMFSENTAELLADAKEEYCAETDENARAQLRADYNAEMDKRGLPRDQINCP